MKRKTKFSQHFLRSKRILHKISRALEIKPEDVIVEIGGGHGELTKFLLSAKKLIVYEIDPKLVKILKQKFPSVEIKQENFLRADLKKWQNQYKLVGNIPYAITGKIFRKILSIENKPKILVFTLQKEVAEKMLAKGKENFWSCWLKIWGKPEKICTVPAKYFQPSPKVDSVVLKITFYPKPLVKEPEKFAHFLKKLFAYPKRKLKHQPLILPPKYREKRPTELSLTEILDLFRKINMTAGSKVSN